MHILTRDRSFYRSLILLAIPVALQNLITFLVGFADNLMIGALGDAAVSGVFMGNQMQILLQTLSSGVESAILVLAAQYWGTRDTEGIRRIVATGLRFLMIFSILLTLACSLFPYQLMRLFSTSESVVQAGASYLRVVCFSYLFFCITQVLISAMRSVEVARIGLIVSLISLFLYADLITVLSCRWQGYAPSLNVPPLSVLSLWSGK